ncbi:hypothetical protein K504DRAFT_286137 [Pleomassaria siparia CBS 279.74]|uniref:Uncharacterized protein n=1 Tax=Pleomassaria siparia CBS 279.74 TaxID=1314801 RepID=A0A6G1K828_9PLEO|nr:hypothetical protein K504DRAFT_286137 [Pleomassaria siparia CBS 279.74]
MASNTVYCHMRDVMRGSPNKWGANWKIKTHPNARFVVHGDSTHMNVSSFKTEAELFPGRPSTKRGIVNNVLFRDLDRGIKLTPFGFDALDMPGCIAYAKANLDVDYMYPDHFEQIKSIIGPATVNRNNYDNMVWIRWSKTVGQHINAYVQISRDKRLPATSPVAHGSDSETSEYSHDLDAIGRDLVNVNGDGEYESDDEFAHAPPASPESNQGIIMDDYDVAAPFGSMQSSQPPPYVHTAFDLAGQWSITNDTVLSNDIAALPYELGGFSNNARGNNAGPPPCLPLVVSSMA